jgi:DNA-binding PadR family transcriptional regulator
MSPVFRHGRLRLYLLKLLDETPRHGYEIIRLLQDRFLGVYAPSPGTIYPRLARLEEEGLVTHDEADGRKIYRITEKGREELRRRLDDLTELEETITASVRDIAREVTEDVRETVRSLREELASAARDIHAATGHGRPGGHGRPHPWHPSRPGGQSRAGTGADRTDTGADQADRAGAGADRADRAGAGADQADQADTGAGRAGAGADQADRAGAGADQAGAGADQADRADTGADRAGAGADRAGAGADQADTSADWAGAGADWIGAREHGAHEHGAHEHGAHEHGRGEDEGGEWGDWARWAGRQGWASWAGWPGGGPPGCADPRTYRDFEKLARHFTRQLRMAAWQAQAVSEDAVAGLRLILDDAIERIRSEVFGAHAAHSDTSGHDPGEDRAPGRGGTPRP